MSGNMLVLEVLEVEGVGRRSGHLAETSEAGPVCLRCK